MTIPPDVLARAREAFWKHCPTSMARRAGMGFDDALSVLSAEWPAADGRLRKADKIVAILDRMARQLNVSDGYSRDRDPDVWRIQNSHVWDMMTEIAGIIAFSPPSAPAAPVRIVRVAVAESLRGLPFVEVTDGPDDDDEAFDALANHRNAPVRLCIAEIPVPVRDVPTVRASVEAPHD